LIYRQADAADAAALSEFANRIFLASFEQQVPRSELEPFATSRFAPEKLRDAITHGGGTIFLALDSGIIGYAQVAVGNRPGCTLHGDAPAELTRIYVDAEWQGRGVAQQLMHLVERDAAASGCDVLWLAVWDENARGRAFYDKCGFSIVGSNMFQVGRLTLRHYYLAKSLRDLS
jgi:ribosomal protein S18 acetylase RimI-like enzyme